MEPIAVTSGAPANVPAATTVDATSKLTTFEEQLEAAGAKLHSVSGGKHDGRLLNVSGNARTGQLFEIVHRHGRTYHVYGAGDHRLVIGMPPQTGGTEAAA